jgi:VanZ family protein
VEKPLPRLIIPSLFALTAIGIFVLSLFLSAPNIMPEITFTDKIEHAFAYLVLSLLFCLTFRGKWTNRVMALMIPLIACTLYGGLLEWLQLFTGRNCDGLDLASDAAGALLGAILFMVLPHVKTGRPNNR